MSIFKSFLSTKNIVGGLDIGTQSIKMVQMSKTASGYQIDKMGSIATPAMCIKDGTVINPESLSESIKRLIELNKFTANKVVTTVSGPSVVMRPINMSVMTEKELQKAIKFEAERYLPYSVEDASIQGTVLRKAIEGDEKNMEVLLVAAPSELINKCTETIKLSSLEISSIDLEPFALMRVFQNYADPEIFKKTVALLDMGSSTSSINIFKEGILRHNRTVNIAGNNFTKAISQALNLSFEESEKIKKDKGAIKLEEDNSATSPTAMRIFNVIVPVLNEMLTEIQRSFDYYRSRYKNENVDLIVLSGGTSNFTNIEAYIGKELGFPVQKATPLANISTDKLEGFTPEQLQEIAPEFMVALGLGMKPFV
ncbi:MAG: type IV pilus assembly protein PilM [Armatimonadota bacterium]